MADKSDITRWLPALKEGDEEAAQRVWEQYYDRLIRLAANNLRALKRRESDEDDIVLSAMNSFFQGARQGRFPRLEDRENLWSLLVVFTIRKVSKERKRQEAAKRAEGKVRGESVFAHAEEEGGGGLNEAVVDREPSPEVAAEIAETLELMLRELRTDELRRIALLKLEGWTNREIAEKLGVVVETVRRKLKLIQARCRRRFDQGDEFDE